MLKSHEKFHSSNGKRLVLVADDEEIIYCNSVLAVIPMRGNCSGGTGGRKSR